MSENNDKKIPAFDYRTGKDGARYEGDFDSNIYEHKVVPTNGQPAASLPGPPAPGDVRPDGKPYHGGIVQTKQAHWH
jgi:hypothetical protein